MYKIGDPVAYLPGGNKLFACKVSGIRTTQEVIGISPHPAEKDASSKIEYKIIGQDGTDYGWVRSDTLVSDLSKVFWLKVFIPGTE